jgi:hypothetical protein
MASPQIQFSPEKVISQEWLAGNPPAHQALLEKFYGQHPRCMCAGGEGVPLYIARKRSYYLARMPGTGAQHASFCPFYEAPSDLSGQQIYRPSAIQELDDGILSVKLSDGLGVRTASESVSASSASETYSDGKRGKLSIIGILNLLWERAGLNQWYPAMAGKRSYGVLYKYLRAAAEQVVVKDSNLLNYLYVPEPFVESKAAEIARAAEHTLYHLLIDRSGRPKRGMVVGLVRRIFRTKYGYGLQLKHAPGDLTFWLRDEAAETYARKFARTDNLEQSMPETGLLVAVMLVERTSKGSNNVVKMASMTVDKRFIPFSTNAEKALLDHLGEGRIFNKQLKYDATSKQLMPAVLLRDVGAAALPMYILGDPEVKARADGELREKVHEIDAGGGAIWFWDRAWDPEVPPKLPPKH